MTNNVDDVVVITNESSSVTHVPMTYSKLPITTYEQFGRYLKLKYLNNESAINLNEEKEFDYIFNLGLIQAKNNLHNHDSQLLHKGKKPRRDEWERLGSIASELLKIYSYPMIPSGSLTVVLNKALGNRDPRTIRDYKRTVLLYCNLDEFQIKHRDYNLGQLDVSFFVHLIPKQYINTSTTASSTSFSEDNNICSNSASLGIKND